MTHHRLTLILSLAIPTVSVSGICVSHDIYCYYNLFLNSLVVA